MAATHSILLAVSATLNADGTPQPVPDGCAPGGRTFALSEGYAAQDRVALYGSTDAGESFTPVMVGGIPVVLTSAVPQVVIENGCEYYRTRRTGKGLGSTLSDVGGTMTENGSGTASGSLYGDGHDGAVTVTTPIVLTRDMYYDSLDVSADGEIGTAGFRVFARRYIHFAGFAYCQGHNATTRSGGTSDGVNHGLAGGDGSTGGSAGAPGQSASTTAVLSLSIAHAGGNGGLGAGGAGGSKSAGAPVATPARDIVSAIANEYLRAQAGGGGGGGGDASTGDGGGGGGSGGFGMFVAPDITFIGAANFSGGNGAGGFATNAGGGGGGGGGTLYFIGETIDTTDASITVAGGTGGISGGGTGVAGVTGAAGEVRSLLVA